MDEAAVSYLKNKYVEYETKGQWPILYQKLRNDAEKQERTLKLTTKISHYPQNLHKNRYRDVSPYDHCRITLNEYRKKSDYINATPIRIEAAERNYILSQGPLSSTVDDFWRMIWEQNCSAIVMLNRIIEKNAHKCFPYFPDENRGSHLAFPSFVVILKEQVRSSHFIIRELEVRERIRNDSPSANDTGSDSSNDDEARFDEEGPFELTKEIRHVTHYQFVTWPDFGVPQSTEDFLWFLHKVRKSRYLDGGDHGPAVVHCSAGIGRTGTFVIVDAILIMIQNCADPRAVDICELVLELRKSRMGLIQTTDQLRFSWKAIVDAISDTKWSELLSLSQRSNSPAKRLHFLGRGTANQMTSDGSSISVDESELRKRSRSDEWSAINRDTAKGARVNSSGDNVFSMESRRSNDRANKLAERRERVKLMAERIRQSDNCKKCNWSRNAIAIMGSAFAAALAAYCYNYYF